MIPKTRLAHSDDAVIICNDCRQRTSVIGGGRGTPGEIRYVAARSGWSSDGKKEDYCPKDTKLREEKALAEARRLAAAQEAADV